MRKLRGASVQRMKAGVGVGLLLFLILYGVAAVAGSGRLPQDAYESLLKWRALGPFAPLAAADEFELVLVSSGPVTYPRLAELEGLGVTVEGVSGQDILAKGKIPAFSALERGGQGLAWVRVARTPMPTLTSLPGGTPSISSVAEVASAIGVDHLHAQRVLGRGVRVGVIDLGFTGALRQYLPGGRVHYLRVAYQDTEKHYAPYFLADDLGEWNPGGWHGEACARTIAELAPEAEFFLISAPKDTQRQSAWQLVHDDKLVVDGRTVRLDVISDSTFNACPTDFGDGQGQLAQWADEVVKRFGTFCAFAVGNLALGKDTDRTYYAAAFRDDDKDGSHDFNPSGTMPSERNLYDIWVTTENPLSPGQLDIFLTWDDWPWQRPLGRPREDFVLTLSRVSPAGEREWGTKSSDRDQCVDAYATPSDPLEDIHVFVPSGHYQLSIARKGEGSCGDETSLPRLRLFIYTRNGAVLAVENHTAEGSLIDLASAHEVISIGGMSWTGSEWAHYPPSSRGPTGDEARRTKPELVAPTSYYSPVCDGAFSGTSASAPVVAGVAALLHSAFPGLSSLKLSSALLETARDFAPPGPDNLYGYGFVDAWEAYKRLSEG